MSADSCINLGAFIITNTSWHIQARISTEIKVALTSSDSQCTSSGYKVLRDIIEGEAWIYRGRGFKIYLVVTLNSQLRHDEQYLFDALERCAVAIRDAKFWDQLDLTNDISPVELHCGSAQPASALITFHINHNRAKHYTRTSVSHRLARGEHYSDVKAPEGVQTNALQEVIIRTHLEYGLCDVIKDTDNLTRDDSIFADSTNHRIPFKTTLELISNGFLRALTNIPEPLPVSTEITNEEREKNLTLAEVAPAMWNPQYLEAIAERSVFLPTISNSLAAATMALSSSISDNRRQNHLDFELNPQTRVNELSQRFSTQLWKMLQKGSYKKNKDSKRLIGADLTHISPDIDITDFDFEDERLSTYSDDEEDFLNEDFEMLNDAFSVQSILESNPDDLEHPSTSTSLTIDDNLEELDTDRDTSLWENWLKDFSDRQSPTAMHSDILYEQQDSHQGYEQYDGYRRFPSKPCTNSTGETSGCTVLRTDSAQSLLFEDIIDDLDINKRLIEEILS